MNWDALGAIAEAIGALAVVMSLVYFGYQIRETRITVRAQSAQARTELATSLMKDWADILVKTKNLSEIDDADRIQLRQFFLRNMMNHQNLYYQQKTGALDPLFAGPLKTMNFYRQGAPRAWWDEYGRTQAVFGAEYVAYVDSILESVPPEV